MDAGATGSTLTDVVVLVVELSPMLMSDKHATKRPIHTRNATTSQFPFVQILYDWYQFFIFSK